MSWNSGITGRVFVAVAPRWKPSVYWMYTVLAGVPAGVSFMTW